MKGIRRVNNRDRKIYGVTFLGLIGCYGLHRMRTVGSPNSAVQLSFLKHVEREPRFLDGCRYVYVDVGTNVGLQIRKLFEPEVYPAARILPHFDAWFGRDRASNKELCAVGFEPNVHLTKGLKELEAAYNQKGWRVKIFTETAAGKDNGEASFFFDQESKDYEHEWGASIIPWQKGMLNNPSAKSTVTVMDFAQFLNEEVGGRVFDQSDNKPPMVAMKLDMEGAEWETLPKLITSGALCTVNATYTELHTMGAPPEYTGQPQDNCVLNVIKYLLKSSCPGYNDMFVMDDEDYQTSPAKPLPSRRRRLLSAGTSMAAGGSGDVEVGHDDATTRTPTSP